MRAGSIIVAGLVALLVAAPARATPHFTIGHGQNPGVAVDAAGTAYIGWKVNVYDPGDAVQLCVLPRGARSCASLATIPFPGAGYNLGRVSVLLPAPGVVQVTVGRDVENDEGSYLTSSVDGGRTFGPPLKIDDGRNIQTELLPDGRLALDGNGAGVLNGAVIRPDGADAESDRVELGDWGQFSDVTVHGGDVYIAGSGASPSVVVRLPAGASSVDPAAWQRLPALNGIQPELAPGPAGPVAMLEPLPASKRSQLFAQRWTGTAWTPPVVLGGLGYNDSFALNGAAGRLTALWSVSPPGFDHLVEMVTSTDGGTLWSSPAMLAEVDDSLYDLELATAPDGRGVAVNGGSTETGPIEVFVVDPRRARAERARFGDTTVQLRTDLGNCVQEERVRLRIQAARGGLLVSPGTVLRRARVTVRRSRVIRRSRWTTLVDLRRDRAKRTATVRLVPRSGRARTLRLAVRGCGRIA